MENEVSSRSHFLLTLLLLPLLRRSRGRVVNLSSVVHRSADLEHFELTTRRREPYVSQLWPYF